MARKKVTVSLSRRAEKDLNEIYRYLSEHSESTLVKVDEMLFKILRRLEFFPLSGHFVKEFQSKRYREALVFHYRIIYRFLEKEKRVQVMTIRHGKRFFPTIQITSTDSR